MGQLPFPFLAKLIYPQDLCQRASSKHSLCRKALHNQSRKPRIKLPRQAFTEESLGSSCTKLCDPCPPCKAVAATAGSAAAAAALCEAFVLVELEPAQPLATGQAVLILTDHDATIARQRSQEAAGRSAAAASSAASALLASSARAPSILLHSRHMQHAQCRTRDHGDKAGRKGCRTSQHYASTQSSARQADEPAAALPTRKRCK